jgi:RNA polymerase sigma-70 factor (ECF subfamily)
VRLAPADAEDLLQEALLRAWQRWHTYDATRGTVAAWLCAIVLDQSRQRSRRVQPDPVIVLPPEMRDDAQAVDLEMALRRLAPRQRQVVELYYFVGLPVGDVAVVLGIGPGTVKSTLSDARTRLRQLLEVPA